MSNNYCSVSGCNSLLRKNRDISFHSFPERGKESIFTENKFGVREKIDRQKAWVHKLKIGKPISKHMKVCSLYFTECDYLPKNNYSMKLKCLKKLQIRFRNQYIPLFTLVDNLESKTEI